VVFTLAALVAIAVIHIRREKVGGELGGPVGIKILSSLLLVLLWFFYIALSVWKIVFQSADLWSQVIAIFGATVVLATVMLIAGIVLYVAMGMGTKPSVASTPSGSSLSFTGAAMVCVAVNRLKRATFKRRQALAAEDLESLAQCSL